MTATATAATGGGSEPLLVVEGVVASYDGATNILQGVDLTAQSGAIVAVLGGNGAGKSTTLKAIAGLMRIGSGRIVFRGEDITRLRPHQIVQHKIAFAVQGKDVFPSMTVEENLLLGAFSRSDSRAIADDMARLYDVFPSLYTRRGQSAALLSGGERQMLVLARGLMSRPILLMVDEPSAALSPRMVDEVMATLARLRQEGLSILLVEQNVNAALDIADRFVVLRDGRNVAAGDVNDRRDFEDIKKAYYNTIMGDVPPRLFT